VRNYPAAELDEAVTRVGGHWAPLNGGRILLTGATGFIGGWMLDTLAAAVARGELKVELLILARNRERLLALHPWIPSAPWVSIVAGDVRTLSPVGPLSDVIHCASAASPEENARDPFGVEALITGGAERMAKVALAGGRPRFLQMSSGSVHSSPPISSQAELTALGEREPASPAQRFARAKRLAEHSAIELVGAICPRVFALLGPGLPFDGAFAAGNFLHDALAGGPIIVVGDGTPERSWMYPADLSAWCWTLLAAAPPGSTWDVGGAEVSSMRELAERIASHCDGVAVEVRGSPTTGAAPDRYVPDIRAVAQAFGLLPWTDLDTSIRRTIAWTTTR
jgi:nucleoside-diphosphate-sugar epimerase